MGQYEDYLDEIKQLSISKNSENYSKDLFLKDKSAISNLPTPIDFNKTHIQDLAKSKTKLKKINKYNNKNNKPLEKWYDMSKPELTEELENDLKAIYNRGALDPKAFYRKS